MPPIVLALIPVLVPLAGKLLTDLLGKRVPKRAKPYVAVAIGAGAGVVAHYAGLPPETAVLIATAGGPGAVAAHELVQKARGAR